MRFHRPEVMVALVLLSAGLIVAQTAAMAQGASPLTFLEGVYKVYRNNSNAKGVEYSKPETIRRTFAPPLAKAILKDFSDAKKKDEIPSLNGDPFIDAQDWQIADLKVDVRDVTPRRATGVVRFTDAKQPRTIQLDLVKTGDGWRIAEIKAPSGSLKERFKVK